jgi:hypothetical protein
MPPAGAKSDYTIKVTGSDQLQFSGHYTIARAGNIPRPVEVKGTVPAEYKGKGAAAACVFRKVSTKGTLKVEILKGEKVVATSETTAPYGIITLGKMPEKDSIINQMLGKILD